MSSLAMARGGEVFVPKIPSMSTADLARAMAPDLPHRIIGIRPGEKLHEIMIPEDDSRTTVELEDRYAILPAHSAKLMARYLATGAHLVTDGFSYASNTNPEQLDGKALRRLIGQAEAA
jgi:UDP-N-acetylglucosamine 4,6-dehydratase